MSDLPENVKLGLVGPDHPCREGKSIPATIFSCPRNETLEANAAGLAEKLGYPDLSGVTLSRNSAKLPEFAAGDEIALSETPDGLGFQKMGVLVVTKAATEEAAAAPAAAAAPTPPADDEPPMKVGFVGADYPCREGRAVPATVLSLPKNTPLSSLAGDISAALGVPDLSGISLTKNAEKLPEYGPGEAVDMGQSLVEMGFAKLAVFCVEKKEAEQAAEQPAEQPSTAEQPPTTSDPPAAAAAAPDPNPPVAPVAPAAAAAPAPVVASVGPAGGGGGGGGGGGDIVAVPPTMMQPAQQVIEPSAPQSQADLARLVELQRSELTRLRQELLQHNANEREGSLAPHGGEMKRARQMVEAAAPGQPLEQLLVQCVGNPNVDGVYRLCGLSDGMPVWGCDGFRLQSSKGYWVISDVPGHSVSGVMRSSEQHKGRMPQIMRAWSNADLNAGRWTPSSSNVTLIDLPTATTGHTAFHMVQNKNSQLERQLAESLLKSMPQQYLVTSPNFPQLEGLYEMDADISSREALQNVHPLYPLYRKQSSPDTVLYAGRGGAWRFTTSGVQGLQDGVSVVRSTTASDSPDAVPRWEGMNGLSGWDMQRMTVIAHNELAPMVLQSAAMSEWLRAAGQGLLRETYVKWLRYTANMRMQHKWAVRLNANVRSMTAGALLNNSDSLLLRTYFRKLLRGGAPRELGQSVPDPPAAKLESHDLPVDAAEGDAHYGSTPHRGGYPAAAAATPPTPLYHQRLQHGVLDASPSLSPPPYSSSGGSPSPQQLSPSPQQLSPQYSPQAPLVLPPPPIASSHPLGGSPYSLEDVVARGVEGGIRAALSPQQRGMSSSIARPSRMASVASVQGLGTELPVELEVSCPASPDLSGIYTLSNHTINRRAVWRKGKCALYSTNDAYNWMLTDTPGTEVMNRGWVRSRGPHRDRAPQEIPQWERWGGQGWEQDDSVTVLPKYSETLRGGGGGGGGGASGNFRSFCTVCGAVSSMCRCPQAQPRDLVHPTLSNPPSGYQSNVPSPYSSLNAAQVNGGPWLTRRG